MSPTAHRRPAAVNHESTSVTSRQIAVRVLELADEHDFRKLSGGIIAVLADAPDAAPQLMLNKDVMRYFNARSSKRWEGEYGPDVRSVVSKAFADAWMARSQVTDSASVAAYEASVDDWITGGPSSRQQGLKQADTGVRYRIGSEISKQDPVVWRRALASGALSLGEADVKRLASEQDPGGFSLLVHAMTQEQGYLHLNVFESQDSSKMKQRREAVAELRTAMVTLHDLAPKDQQPSLRATLAQQGGLWKALTNDLAAQHGLETPIDDIPLKMPTESWNRAMAFARARPDLHRALIHTGNPLAKENYSGYSEATGEQERRAEMLAAIIHRGLGDAVFDQLARERLLASKGPYADDSKWVTVIRQEMSIPARDDLRRTGYRMVKNTIATLTLLSEQAGTNPIAACDRVAECGSEAIAQLAAVHGEAFRRTAFLTLVERTVSAEDTAESRKSSMPVADLFRYADSSSRLTPHPGHELSRTTAERSAILLLCGKIRKSEAGLTPMEGFRALAEDIRPDPDVRSAVIGVLVSWAASGCADAIELVAMLGDESA